MTTTLRQPIEPTVVVYICDWCGRREQHDLSHGDLVGIHQWFHDDGITGLDGLRVNHAVVSRPRGDTFCSAFCALSAVAYANRGGW